MLTSDNARHMLGSIQSLDVGAAQDRQQILNLAVMFNVIVGAAFLFTTFFQSYGAGMGFHATTTAMAHLGLSVVLSQWLKRPDPHRIDILGGMALCMDLMLLQTTILWSSLAGGMVGGAGGAQPAPCVVLGGGGDRATSAFAGILLVSNVGTQVMAYMWRGDWLGASGPAGYGPITPDVSFQGGAPLSGGRRTAPAQQQLGGASTARDGFLDSDPEGGL
jgi:hypothetical protein